MRQNDMNLICRESGLPIELYYEQKSCINSVFIDNYLITNTQTRTSVIFDIRFSEFFAGIYIITTTYYHKFDRLIGIGT